MEGKRTLKDIKWDLRYSKTAVKVLESVIDQLKNSSSDSLEEIVHRNIKWFGEDIINFSEELEEKK